MEHNYCVNGDSDKFQSQSLVILCRHCKRQLKYILFKFHFTSVTLKSHEAGPLCWTCQFFMFLLTLVAFYDTVSLHQAGQIFIICIFLSAIILNVNLTGPQQEQEQAPHQGQQQATEWSRLHEVCMQPQGPPTLPHLRIYTSAFAQPKFIQSQSRLCIHATSFTQYLCSSIRTTPMQQHWRCST